MWGCLILRDGIPIDAKGGLAAGSGSTKSTNNVAEYQALVNALGELKRLGFEGSKTTVFTDSPLIMGHFKEGLNVGLNLVTLNTRVRRLMESFPLLDIVRIPRTQNKVAHRIARAAYYESRIAQLEKKS